MAAAGADIPASLSESDFIRVGIELEERKSVSGVVVSETLPCSYRLYRRLLKETARNVNEAAGYQQTRLSTQRALLHRNIAAWIACQNIYMPSLVDLRVSGFDPREKDSTVPGDEAPASVVCSSTSDALEETTSASPAVLSAVASSMPKRSGLRPTAPMPAVSVIIGAPGAFPFVEDANISLDGTLSGDDGVQAEDILLLLPSDIPASHRERICTARLIVFECRFRLAQLSDGLARLRKALRVFGVSKSEYRGELSAGTKHGTKARTHLKGLWSRVTFAATGYRIARGAMLALDADDQHEWQERFKELHNVDIRGPYPGDDNSDLQATLLKRRRDAGAGRSQSSWIWTVRDGELEQPTEQVRVHWSKMSAYAERWEEELTMLPKEMHRTVLYLEWEAGWWLTQVERRTIPGRPVLNVALNAYAHRQASIRRQRVTVFLQTWIPLLEEHRGRLPDVGWLDEYVDLVDRKLADKRRTAAATRAARKAKRAKDANERCSVTKAPEAMARERRLVAALTEIPNPSDVLDVGSEDIEDPDSNTDDDDIAGAFESDDDDAIPDAGYEDIDEQLHYFV
jgi:hypothetical protein